MHDIKRDKTENTKVSRVIFAILKIFIARPNYCSNVTVVKSDGMEEHYISSTPAENFSYSRLDVVSVLDKEDPMVLATSYTMYKIGKLSYF